MSNICRKCGKEMHKDRMGHEQICKKCRPSISNVAEMTGDQYKQTLKIMLKKRK